MYFSRIIYFRQPLKELVYVKHISSSPHILAFVLPSSTYDMLKIFFVQAALLTLSGTAAAFPSHMSLAGLTREQLDQVVPTLTFVPPPPPPGPLNDTSAKLVNDPAHPWMPLQPGDIRGVCPGLNTLASHGVRCTTAVKLFLKLIASLFNAVPPPQRYSDAQPDHLSGPRWYAIFSSTLFPIYS